MVRGAEEGVQGAFRKAEGRGAEKVVKLGGRGIRFDFKASLDKELRNQT